MIAVLIRTDGRDELLDLTINSLESMVLGPITRKIIHTDNGDSHVEYLQHQYADWEIIGGERLGFGGAIDRAWRHIARTNKDRDMFLFDTEDDFIFKRPVMLVDMVSVLMQQSHVAQLVLRRQPWNEAERAAGGIVEMWPDEYTERVQDDCAWLEHRLFWSTNPSIFHIERCNSGWPVEARSERIYSDLVFSNPETVCAYWGPRLSGVWVEHIGDERVGHSY